VKLAIPTLCCVPVLLDGPSILLRVPAAPRISGAGITPVMLRWQLAIFF
jgi:hypothetical protein